MAIFQDDFAVGRLQVFVRDSDPALQAHVDQFGLQQLAPQLIAVLLFGHTRARCLGEQLLNRNLILSGDAGGQLPQTKLSELPPALARAALQLEVGEASVPLRVGDDYVIVRVDSRDASQLPSFDEARRELGDRVYMDKMGQARRTWLDGLRRRNHVEVRL